MCKRDRQPFICTLKYFLKDFIFSKSSVNLYFKNAKNARRDSGRPLIAPLNRAISTESWPRPPINISFTRVQLGFLLLPLMVSQRLARCNPRFDMGNHNQHWNWFDLLFVFGDSTVNKIDREIEFIIDFWLIYFILRYERALAKRLLSMQRRPLTKIDD